jgi:hypothetical protein
VTIADYQVTDADRRPLPRSYRTEPRHLGYRDDDLSRPFAHYLDSTMLPLPPHVDRAWAEERFRQIVRWRTPEIGGHFPSLEVPDYYTEDLQKGLAAVLAATR